MLRGNLHGLALRYRCAIILVWPRRSGRPAAQPERNWAFRDS
jgi:hypothetical protein